MNYIHNLLVNSVFFKSIQSYFIEEPEKTNYQIFTEECSRFLYYLYDFVTNKNLYPDSNVDIGIVALFLLVIAVITITAIRIRVTIKKANLGRMGLEVGRLRFIVDLIARALHVQLDHQVNSLTAEDYADIRENRMNLEKLMFSDDSDRCSKHTRLDSPTEMASEEEETFDGPADKGSQSDSNNARVHSKRYELPKKCTKKNIHMPQYQQDNECAEYAEYAAERLIKIKKRIEQHRRRSKGKSNMKTTSQFSTADEPMNRSNDDNLNNKSAGKELVKVERQDIVEGTSGFGDAVVHSETDRYEEDPYETDRYETNRYETVRYETVRYERERYETVRYETDRYEIDQYETDREETDRYETDRDETDRYETDRDDTDRDETDRYETSTPTEISDYDENAIRHVEIFVPPSSNKLKSILKKRTRASIDDSDRLSEPSTPRQTSDSLESETDANGTRVKRSKKHHIHLAVKKPVVRRMVRFWDELKTNANGTRVPHKAQIMITKKKKTLRSKKTKEISSDSCDSQRTRSNFKKVGARSRLFLMSDENTHCEAITKTVVVSEIEDGLDNISGNEMEMIIIPPLRIGKSKKSKKNVETSEDSTPLTVQPQPNHKHNSNMTTPESTTPDTLLREASTISKQSSSSHSDTAKAATTTSFKKTAAKVNELFQQRKVAMSKNVTTLTIEQKKAAVAANLGVQSAIPIPMRNMDSTKITGIPRTRTPLRRSATTIPRIWEGTVEQKTSTVRQVASSARNSNFLTKPLEKYASYNEIVPFAKQKQTEESVRIPSSSPNKSIESEINKETEIFERNKVIREHLTISRLETIIEELSGESTRSKLSDEKLRNLNDPKISPTSNTCKSTGLSIKHKTIIPSVQPLTPKQREERIKFLSKLPVEKCMSDMSVQHPRKFSASSGIPGPIPRRRMLKKSKTT